MGTNEVGGVHYHSDTEIVGSERMVNYSGPLSGPLNKRSGNKKTAKFNIAEPAGSAVKPGISTSDEEPYVEVILDVREDSVAVHSVKPGADDHEDHVEMTLLGKGLEKNQSPKGSSVVRTASARIKQVSQELKRLASFSKQAVAAPHPRRRFDRTQSAAAPALKGLKFISKTDGNAGWPAVEKKFDALTASSNGLLPRSLFGQCIGMNKDSNEFAGKLFDALARKLDIREDSITKEQLNEFWAQISEQGFDSRLQTFFDMVDKDADGRITIEEVKEIISFSASANKLSNIQNQADEYAALIMEELDPYNLGHIEIDSLETLLLQGPEETAVRGKDSRNLSKMLSQKLKPTREHPLRRWCSDIKYFLQDNWKRVWVVTLWVGIMAGLFAYKYVQYRNKAAYEVMGQCVCMAKGAAETLKFNMALILLPVCRNTITLLRNKTKLGIVVPFDDNLNFHKVIAIGIGIGVGIHGISHLACDFPRIIHASSDKYELMKPFFGDNQPSNYWHFLKSLEGVSGIVMVVLMAIAFTLAAPCFRKGQLKLPEPLKKLTEPLKKLTGFNAFWYSHHLFIIVYVLLIIHGVYLYLTKEWYKKTTWMYLAVPLTLYAGERLVRALRSSIKPVQILKVALYPGNVLALHLSKPQGFRYHSGQYMFVKCAAVSPFEWHPFSITSAPGDNHLSVHIRIVGDWTQQLKTVFSQVCQPPPSGKSGLLRADHMQGADNLIFPKVLIDGPYGAPAQDYKDYEVVLLVGLGIGATPMISILKDIVNNIKAIEEEGEDMGALENGAPSRISKVGSGSGSSQLGLHNFKTKRAYFYWVTREQGSFDWFKGAMNEVAELDHNRVIEFHNYCTSVYEEGDARSALIHMLQSLSHAKNGVDIVSGTRVKSHFAKPNWREVYKRIALDHTNATVGVFYCGLPALANELRQLSHDFSHKTTTQFDFHKENF